MTSEDAQDIDLFLTMLESQDVDERVKAIEILGEIGDEQALALLRERLRPVNKELVALIAAIGKLKKKFGR